MKLDWVEQTGKYILRVPAAERSLVNVLMNEHGLEFSLPASRPDEAVLFTGEDYAAVTFFEHATPAAAARLRHIQDQIDASWAPESSAHIRVPEDRELWPFQRAGVAYALGRQHTLVGDQPGLGKTNIAIAFANELKAKRVLVICPASVRLQWAKRIREWTTMPWPFTVHTILNGKRGVHPNAAWTVVSYELAATPAIGAALAARSYDLLILDEAHYLKTVDARRTRAVFGGGEARTFEALAHRAERIMALTGTPLPNRPREAYTLARGLCFDAVDWMSEDAFRERFNPSEKRESKSGKVYIDERTGRHAELQNRLRGNFMVRHEKRQVMSQLHMPVFDFVYMEETAPIKAALNAERLLDIDPENLAGADFTVLGHISVVRKQMGVAMAPQVANYVDMLMDGGEEKLVVFAWHIEVLNLLQERFQKHGVLRVDGSTNAVRKDAIVQKFIKDPSIKIILGNLLAMGTGVDGLQQVCNHVLLAEVDWTPANNQQAVDRLDRGGQREQVQADFCVVKGSFSEKVMATALRKLNVIDKALDRKNNSLNASF